MQPSLGMRITENLSAEEERQSPGAGGVVDGRRQRRLEVARRPRDQGLGSVRPVGEVVHLRPRQVPGLGQSDPRLAFTPEGQQNPDPLEGRRWLHRGGHPGHDFRRPGEVPVCPLEVTGANRRLAAAGLGDDDDVGVLRSELEAFGEQRLTGAPGHRVERRPRADQGMGQQVEPEPAAQRHRLIAHHQGLVRLAHVSQPPQQGQVGQDEGHVGAGLAGQDARLPQAVTGDARHHLHVPQLHQALEMRHAEPSLLGQPRPAAEHGGRLFEPAQAGQSAAGRIEGGADELDVGHLLGELQRPAGPLDALGQVTPPDGEEGGEHLEADRLPPGGGGATDQLVRLLEERLGASGAEQGGGVARHLLQTGGILPLAGEKPAIGSQRLLPPAEAPEGLHQDVAPFIGDGRRTGEGDRLSEQDLRRGGGVSDQAPPAGLDQQLRGPVTISDGLPVVGSLLQPLRLLAMEGIEHLGGALVQVGPLQDGGVLNHGVPEEGVPEGDRRGFQKTLFHRPVETGAHGCFSEPGDGSQEGGIEPAENGSGHHRAPVVTLQAGQAFPGEFHDRPGHDGTGLGRPVNGRPVAPQAPGVEMGVEHLLHQQGTPPVRATRSAINSGGGLVPRAASARLAMPASSRFPTSMTMACPDRPSARARVSPERRSRVRTDPKMIRRS